MTNVAQPNLKNAAITTPPPWDDVALNILNKQGLLATAAVWNIKIRSAASKAEILTKMKTFSNMYLNREDDEDDTISNMDNPPPPPDDYHFDPALLNTFLEVVNGDANGDANGDKEDEIDDMVLQNGLSDKNNDTDENKTAVSKHLQQEMSTTDGFIKQSSIRRLSFHEHVDNERENKLIAIVITLSITIIIVCIILWQINPDKFVFDLMFFPQTIVLLLIESIWHMLLSYLVIKYDIKINYTRKLAHLLRIPKYFLVGYLPTFEKNEITALLIFVTSQILYVLMFHRKTREKIYLFQFIFIAQNRIEDQPSTLQFQVTEDFMRFFIYYPITLWIAYKNHNEAIIYIPQMINSIGDGLAEPVGIRFGKHKYKTFALYYDGKWFNGQFTRSIEGSLCVFFTTIIVILIEYFIGIFSNAQLLYLLMTMPFYMTIAEAVAPHTNDGPFLALIGCFTLLAGYEIIQC